LSPKDLFIRDTILEYMNMRYLKGVKEEFWKWATDYMLKTCYGNLLDFIEKAKPLSLKEVYDNFLSNRKICLMRECIMVIIGK